MITPAVKSFVDSGNNGLDGVIPRSVLENAKGFAIFTIFKAGFVFSARAGSGVVIAKLDDGSRSKSESLYSSFLLTSCSMVCTECNWDRRRWSRWPAWC